MAIAKPVYYVSFLHGSDYDESGPFFKLGEVRRTLRARGWKVVPRDEENPLYIKGSSLAYFAQRGTDRRIYAFIQVHPMCPPSDLPRPEEAD
jgi:hypothetical protein